MDKEVAETDKKTVKKREKIEYKSYSFVDKALKKCGMKEEQKRKRVGGMLSVSLFSIGVTVWVWIALNICIWLTQTILMWEPINNAIRRTTNKTLLELVLEALIYLAALFVTIFLPWILLKRKFPVAKTTRNEMGLRGWPTWTDILLSVVGYIVSTLVGGLLLMMGQAFIPGIDWGASQEVGFRSIMSSHAMVMAFVALAVVAPICEELIFRGWMYGKLRARISAVPAILLVSFLFGLVHGQWNVGVVVFCMSVANCLIRELTGTIYGGVLVHIIRNTIAFYGLFVLGL